MNSSGAVFTMNCCDLAGIHQKYGPPATGKALTISAIDNATKMFMIATITHPHSAQNGPPFVYATPNRPATQQQPNSAQRIRTESIWRALGQGQRISPSSGTCHVRSAMATSLSLGYRTMLSCEPAITNNLPIVMTRKLDQSTKRLAGASNREVYGLQMGREERRPARCQNNEAEMTYHVLGSYD